MAVRTTPVCNRDCFNCQFDDCILEEGPNAEEYRELALIDKSLFETPEKRKLAAYKKAYREANREKVAASKKSLDRCFDGGGDDGSKGAGTV